MGNNGGHKWNSALQTKGKKRYVFLHVNIFICSGATPKISSVEYKPVCDQEVDPDSGVAEERFFQYLKTREDKSDGDVHLAIEDYQEGRFLCFHFWCAVTCSH